MKLQYYKGKVPNFGDDLNDWMWRRILPEGILDEDEKELFVGIGSILNSHLPKEPKKYVFGSGFGGYGRPPEVTDEKWDIRFVRGPDTANLINAPAEKAVCDSAILLREVRDLPEPATNIGTALIPHFESLENGYWEQVAEKAGFTLIDPRGDVETILSQIRGADLVITEAMHGAIVADALRIPWIGLLPVNPAHHMKWHDWSKSLNIKLDAQFMPPTSLLEWYINKTKGLKYYDGRAKRYNLSLIHI